MAQLLGVDEANAVRETVSEGRKGDRGHEKRRDESHDQRVGRPKRLRQPPPPKNDFVVVHARHLDVARERLQFVGLLEVDVDGVELDFAQVRPVFLILPVVVFGSSGMKTTYFGTMKFSSLSWQALMISLSVIVTPSSRTQKALTA